MFKYQVGTLYNPKRTKWEENCEYNFRSGVHEIRLFFSNPKPSEVFAVKGEEANFALTVAGDIIVMCFRFGSIPWSDAPYSWHMVPKDQQALPTGEQRAQVTIFLINADNGILLAIRTCSFSSEFSQKLHHAIREQATKPFNQQEYDRQLEELQAKYDSEGLKKLAIARCKGGE